MFFEFFCLLFSDNIIIKIGSILKTCRNVFWCIIFWITFPMCSTSILPYIIRVIFNFTTFIYISHIYFQDFLGKYNRLLHFHVTPAALLLIASFFLLKINYLYCVLSWGLTKLFYAILTSLSLYIYIYIYIMFIFYIFNWWYSRHWKACWDEIFLPIIIMNKFQDIFYIHQSFILNNQDVHK